MRMRCNSRISCTFIGSLPALSERSLADAVRQARQPGAAKLRLVGAGGADNVTRAAHVRGCGCGATLAYHVLLLAPCQLYPNVHWPTLFAKLANLERQNYDWSAQVARITSPVLLMFADADAVQLSHIMYFYWLLASSIRTFIGRRCSPSSPTWSGKTTTGRRRWRG